MRTKRITVLLAMLMAAGVASEVAAQGANLAFVYQITPKNGAGPAFVSAIQDHIAFRAAQGDTWTWQVYEVVIGDNIGNFIVRSGSHTWADMDAYNAMSDFQQAVGSQLAATVAPHVEDWTARTTMTDTLLSNPPPNVDDMNVFAITEVTVDSEGLIGQNQALVQYHDAATDAGMHFGILRTVFGGSVPSFTIVNYAESFADLAEPSPTLNEVMAGAYGDDALDIAQMYLEGVAASNSSVIVLRRDLMLDGN